MVPNVMFTVLLAFLRIIFAGYFRGGFPIGGVRCCVCMLVIFVRGGCGSPILMSWSPLVWLRIIVDAFGSKVQIPIFLGEL